MWVSDYLAQECKNYRSTLTEWNVGPELGIEDIVMSELLHVSDGSWQPVLYRKQPLGEAL